MNINEVFYNQIQDEDEARRLVESVNGKKNPPKKEDETQENPDEEEPDKNPTNPDDKFEVVYADLDKEITNIFEHIIIFTNDDDPKNNKTLKNIYDAVKAIKSKPKPEIHVFIAEDMTARAPS